MKYIIISILSLLVAFSSVGQESKYKALFIYKFLQNIEWPGNKVADKYTVAVLGDSDTFDQLTKLTSGRNVNGKPVEVINYSGSMNEVNLLFLSASEVNQFENLNSEAKANSVVLVTESEGLAKQGAAINFINQGGKLKFEMNSQSLSDAGLAASGSIKSLAILVN